MSTFTIDSDNNITAHAGLPAGADESQSFSNREGTGQAHRRMASVPLGRHLEQLRGRGALSTT